MTDKQIIIDGINIEHCAFYRADGMCNREMLLNQPFDTCERGRKTCYYMQLKRKEQECEELKKYLNQIRDEELSHLDIEWDEYETSARQEDYSNIITLVERALGEVND